MPRALIALGVNLGDRRATLSRAIERLAADAASGLVQTSDFHATEPAGGPVGQEPFLNAAVAFDTSLAPPQLLAALRTIENDLGRERRERWGPRRIDLDILLYDDPVGTPLIFLDPELQIPHPRMAFRRFALEPAATVAADMRHPLFGFTVAELLENLNTSARLVVLAGGTPRRRAEVAEAVTASGQIHWQGEVPLGDSSGRSPAAPLEFAEATIPPGSPRELDADWALAGIDLSGASPTTQGRPKSGVRPRLVALLDDWAELIGAVGGTTQQDDPRRCEALRYAAQPGGPPVLCLGYEESPAQIDELAAAFVAMQ